MLSAEVLIVGGGITGLSIAHFLSDYYKVTLLHSPDLPSCKSLATVFLRNSKIKKNQESFFLFKNFVETFQPKGVFTIQDGFLIDQDLYHTWLKKNIPTIEDTLYSYHGNIAETKHQKIQFKIMILCVGHYNSFFQFYKEPGLIMRGIFAEKTIPNTETLFFEEEHFKLLQFNQRLVRGVYSDHHYSLFYDSQKLEESLKSNLKDYTINVGFRYSEKKGFTPIFLNKNVLYVNGAYKNGYLYSQWIAQKVFECLTVK